MDLEALNPKVYQMYLLQQKYREDSWEPTTESDLSKLRSLVGGRLPDDYEAFQRRYTSVGNSVNIDAGWFPCRYPDRSVLRVGMSLIPSAKSAINAIQHFWHPHRYIDGVGVRIPRELLPLSISNNETILIDLRQESFGSIHYVYPVEKQTFGTPGFGWNQVGYVADSLTSFIKELGTEEELRACYPGWEVE